MCLHRLRSPPKSVPFRCSYCHVDIQGRGCDGGYGGVDGDVCGGVDGSFGGGVSGRGRCVSIGGGCSVNVYIDGGISHCGGVSHFQSSL